MGQSVTVMMSSYNGAAFIEEQIESILDQSDVDVSLHVRDDGSTDGTWDILAAYERAGKISATRGSHAGIGNSFMQLLWSLPDTYDYYAYSDQDDIWMQDKLAVAIRTLEREGAVLYASSLALIDANRQFLGVKLEKCEPHMSTLSCIVNNKCYGCTQVFTKDLFRTLCRVRPSQESLDKFIHDMWTCALASIVGTIVYDPEPHIGYRRHAANYTNFDKDGILKWIKRLNKLVNPGLRIKRSVLAQEVLACYADQLDEREVQQLEVLAGARKFKNRMALAKERSTYMSVNESDAWYMAKLLAGQI